MTKKITDMRIHKQLQSIQEEPIPSVLLQRHGHLLFHFCFYHLEEEYAGGFYHGLLELAADYPFSPPKICFLTNSGRFEVGKFICTSFTHFHKESWSSSWSIRTILTAMISFMYSNERGVGGVFESPQKRRALAAKSLQQNLKNQKFLQLFREKLVELKLVTAERIAQLLRKGERVKRRRRERSQATNAEQIRDIPEVQEGLQAIQEKVVEQVREGENLVTCLTRKLQQTGNEEEELAELEMLHKRRKLQEEEEEVMMERTKTTAQEPQA